jgi:hypothetical protein
MNNCVNETQRLLYAADESCVAQTDASWFSDQEETRVDQEVRATAGQEAGAPVLWANNRGAHHARKEQGMGVTLEQSEALNLLRLEGAVGIGRAAEFKGLLEQALGSDRELRVSLEGATELDVTALQLLWAAERKAKGNGVAFSYGGAMPEAVLSALSEAGLQQFIVPISV